ASRLRGGHGGAGGRHGRTQGGRRRRGGIRGGAAVSAGARRNGKSGNRVGVIAAAVVLGLNAVVFLVSTLPQLVGERNVTARIEALRAQVKRERDLAAALERWSETIRMNERDARLFYSEIVGKRGEELV